MEKNATASRIHPLFAAAAVSVIALSATGIAAMTGILPSSNAQPAANAAPMSVSAPQILGASQAAEAQRLAAAQSATLQLAPQSLQQPALTPVAGSAVPQPSAQAQPERVAAQDVEPREPAPRKTVHRAPARNYAARHQEPTYAPAPVAQQSKPNYVAIGTGAVVGGLLGNQVGSGNGKKIATLAGIIGGGYVGNEIANRNK